MSEEEIQRIKDEEHYSLIGHNVVKESIDGFEAPTTDVPDKNTEFARTLMDAALIDYFGDHQDVYLDPELRKYVIAGATMAYLAWHLKNTIDDGSVRDE